MGILMEYNRDLVRIHFHKEGSIELNDVKNEQLHSMKVQDERADLDVLWKLSIMFGSPRPAWSGMMQHAQHCEQQVKKHYSFFTMENLK